MYAVERQRWLVDHAREAGRLEVLEVADALQVAPETIRRDLKVLERQGLLKRVHGGAVAIERLGFEDRLTVRSTLQADRKARIAEEGLRLIENAETVYLDEGSTVQALAERLNPERPLTVVTNAIPVAAVLAPRTHVTVIMLGGRVREHTLATIEWGTQMLDQLVLDLAILGTNGISIDRGLTCPDVTVAQVKAKAIDVSRRRVLLADGTKFGADSSYRFARVRDLTTIVTDRSADEGIVRKIRAHGVEAVVV
ncbi:MAG: DeoR/GlpR family DNA-binding transcription regulator [Actinomycetota bacterium]